MARCEAMKMPANPGERRRKPAFGLGELASTAARQRSKLLAGRPRVTEASNCRLDVRDERWGNAKVEDALSSGSIAKA